MNCRQFSKLLRNSGFTLERHGRHDIYSDGTSRILVPQHAGRSLDRRLEKMLKVQLKKALEARNAQPV